MEVVSEMRTLLSVVKTRVISVGLVFQSSHLGIHFSFGYLFCKTKGFPGMGGSFVIFLKAAWQESASLRSRFVAIHNYLVIILCVLSG